VGALRLTAGVSSGAIEGELEMHNRGSSRLAAGWFVSAALLLSSAVAEASASTATARQQSLDEWRSLTSAGAPPPQVFVKGDNIRFYFPAEASVVEFRGDWSRVRVPTDGYKVNSALLHWNQKLSRVPQETHGWRQATVIAGPEWRRLATNLLAKLTPSTPDHAACYQAFLSDGVLYRDTQGLPRLAPMGEPPKGIIIEHRYSVEETLDILTRQVEDHLAQTHPGDSLVLLMAPNATHFTQPLLLDRKRRQCVLLSPAALYDTTDRGTGLGGIADGLSGLVLESHGLALLKNPVSSVARLGDLGVGTLVRFLRLPLLNSSKPASPVAQAKGMDLGEWEHWLDTYTGTRRQNGALELLLDGDQFYARLQQALADATNHIHFEVYSFDRDDVAVSIADQLKSRASQIDVKVICDRLGSIGAGLSPPGTPMPEDFVLPASITSYLKTDSRVQVRQFLNPWFSADHTKLYLVDGTRAWLGGMNIGREYRYEWHDAMVEVRGPVVRSLETEFRRHWAHAGALGDLAYAAALLTAPEQPQAAGANNRWVPVRCLPTRTGWKPFDSAVTGSLRKARSYVYAENPYIYDKTLILNLVRARNRGVDVRVVVPRVHDFKTGGRSNLMLANYLFGHGVRVYFYPGMTHVKALLVDDWACVGSGNLNHLSLRYCQEQNIATSDPEFSATLKRKLFEADFARSFELTEPVSVDWVDFLADQVMAGF
jgi:cardiolipin synthase